jgi:hypothetical protein
MHTDRRASGAIWRTLDSALSGNLYGHISAAVRAVRDNVCT